MSKTAERMDWPVASRRAAYDRAPHVRGHGHPGRKHRCSLPTSELSPPKPVRAYALQLPAPIFMVQENDLRANASGVCREGKPVPAFPDHASSAPHSSRGWCRAPRQIVRQYIYHDRRQTQHDPDPEQRRMMDASPVAWRCRGFHVMTSSAGHTIQCRPPRSISPAKRPRRVGNDRPGLPNRVRE
jgi:hypothetical protein